MKKLIFTILLVSNINVYADLQCPPNQTPSPHHEGCCYTGLAVGGGCMVTACNTPPSACPSIGDDNVTYMEQIVNNGGQLPKKEFLHKKDLLLLKKRLMRLRRKNRKKKVNKNKKNK